MPIQTHGGTFEAPTYKRFGIGGVEIELRFRPEDPVLCEAVALTQTARTAHADEEGPWTPESMTPGVKERSLTTSESAENAGMHIDSVGSTNPLYAMASLQSEETLADSKAPMVDVRNSELPTSLEHLREPETETTSVQLAGMGKRWPAEDPVTEEAWLIDKAENAWSYSDGTRGQQTFETTALCVKGDMQGAYLGSVSWGYTYDKKSGKFDLAPLALASLGVPTGDWMKAARKWNANQVVVDQKKVEDDWEDEVVDVKEDSTDLPVTGHVTPDVRELSAHELRQRAEELAEQLHDADPTTAANLRFEMTALEKLAASKDN